MFNNNNKKEEEISELVIRHPMIADLQEVSAIKQLKIKRVDFNTGDIVVTMEGNNSSFEEMIRSISFIDMIEKTAVQAVDFETGEITIRWYSEGSEKINARLQISKKELEYLKLGQKILAIKEIRMRTNCGLKEAKDLADVAQEELKKRGLIR